MMINEIFYSLEGEGEDIGFPTVFIRFSGCNLECSWCDTNHSMGEKMDYIHVLDEVKKYNCNRIKITGGEPLLQLNKLPLLVKMLKDKGYIVSIETNGTIYDFTLFNQCDRICMDLKTPSSNEKSDLAILKRTYDNFPEKIEIKLVISDEEDIQFAERFTYFSDKMILMPCTKSRVRDALIEKMEEKFPNTRFGLRLHEILGVR